MRRSLVWTIGDMWNLLGLVLLANVYLAFPEGRTSGWPRRLVVAIYAWFLAFSLASRAHGACIRRTGRSTTRSWSGRTRASPTTLSTIANVGALVLTILVVGTVLDRWRRGSAVARRALAPVFWVSPITLVVVGHLFRCEAHRLGRPARGLDGPLAQLSNFLLPTRLPGGAAPDAARARLHRRPGARP